MNDEAVKYQLRDLNSTDIFSLSRIIKKIGVANFKKCFDNDEVKKAIAQYLKGENGDLNGENTKNEDKLEGLTIAGIDITFEVVNVIFDRLPECEEELYGFLSSISGLKVAEIQKLPMGDFLDMIIDVIKKPEFRDFFKRASRLFS